MPRAISRRTIDYLLIDISNSYAKFAFASTKRVSTPARVATRKLSSGVISRFLGDRKVRRIVVSSVVPAKNSAIAKAAKKTEVIWLDWKLRHSGYFRHCFRAPHLYRRRDCPRTRNDDQLSLPTNSALAQDFLERAATGGREIDDRGDVIWRSIRLSWLGSGNYRTNQSGAVSEQKSSRCRDRWLRAPDRRALAGDRCGSAASDSGRFADHRQSQCLLFQEAGAFSSRFFRRALKNRVTRATFHLSDGLNKASVATP